MGSGQSCPAAEEKVEGDKLVKNVSGPRLFDLNMDEFHAGDFITIVLIIIGALMVPFFWKAWVRWRRERREERHRRHWGDEEPVFTITSLQDSPVREKRFRAEPEAEC